MAWKRSAAKRYLCATDPGYWNGLSPASRRSLVLQGGPFTGPESQRFIQQPFAVDAVALRRWDDQAKSPTMTTPGWDHYRAVLESLPCSRPGPLLRPEGSNKHPEQVEHQPKPNPGGCGQPQRLD